MKIPMRTLYKTVFVLSIFWGISCTSFPVQKYPEGELPTQQSIINAMEHVADWQLAHPFSYHNPTDWIYGAYWAGLAALADISSDSKYKDALLIRAETVQWKLRDDFYDSNGHCVGQMYLDLYHSLQDDYMIQDIRTKFDQIMATWPEKSEQTNKIFWWWQDALFMSPPVWSRLAEATKNPKYLEFMDEQWQLSQNLLYDTGERLFFRDSRFFEHREPNGQKIFWGRGNGWVYAGLVRVLEYMPKDFANRSKYVELFQQMSERIVSLQPKDGLWRSSLLDPEDYPDPESSGTSFFCYGLAWGVNHGLLDEKTYLSAVIKAWRGLLRCIHKDGMLGYVQDVGAFPTKVNYDDTAIFGTGAFLLAGSEMYKLSFKEAFFALAN